MSAVRFAWDRSRIEAGDAALAPQQANALSPQALARADSIAAVSWRMVNGL
jgi:hypothetical protein